MNYAYLLLIVLFFTFYACQDYKDEFGSGGSIPEPTQPDSYFPLAVGNKWTYELFLVRPDGTDTLLNVEEDYISQDTLIQGQLYYQLKANQFKGSFQIFLRDSSEYLVDNLGNIYFSSTDFSNILRRDSFPLHDHQNYVLIDYQMETAPTRIEIPLGNYHALDFQGNISHYKEGQILLPLLLQHNYHAKGIGKIKHNVFFLFSQYQYERRLIRYELQ
jgi:hypothetical protein